MALSIFSPQDQTIEQRMATHGGMTSGFDYLRLCLSLSIIAVHTHDVTYGHSMQVWAGPWRSVIAGILPMFFALSGFLVMGSLIRLNNLRVFFIFRAVRILPALTVEVLLSALVLGPLLTTYSWGDYFTAPEFRAYFLNILGDIHYHLPGVFVDSLAPGIVNMSLWTIPYELKCYALLLMLGVTSVVMMRGVMLGFTIVAGIGATAHAMTAYPSMGAYLPPGEALIISFLSGLLLYLFRDRVRLSRILFFSCLVLSPVLLQFAWLNSLAAFPLAYVTVWLGLCNPRKDNFLMRGDYSYGIFLFAYPMQQAVATLFPSIRSMPFNFVCAAVLALGWAFLSWHLVEKPILSRKKAVADFLSPRRWLAARTPPAR